MFGAFGKAGGVLKVNVNMLLDIRKDSYAAQIIVQTAD